MSQSKSNFCVTQVCKEIESNSLGQLLWQRCSSLSAGRVIAASDVARQTLSVNSWSLPGGPSGTPPQSWCRSAEKKNSSLPLWIIARTKERRSAKGDFTSVTCRDRFGQARVCSSRCHVSETREIIQYVFRIFPCGLKRSLPLKS